MRTAIATAATVLAFAVLVVFAGWTVMAAGFDSAGVPAASAEDRFLDVGGVRTRYRVTGSGEPTIVLIHGFGGSIESWDVAPRDMPCGRVVALDLPGFGASARPNRSSGLAEQQRWLVQAMTRLGVGRAVLVGASMGGAVAAFTAARAPDRVQALVLVSPSGFPGSLQASGLQGYLARHRLANRVAWWIVHLPSYGWLFPRSLARQSISVTASYDAAYADALREIRAPTLLYWSPGDARVPFAFAAQYLARIRGARLVQAPLPAAHNLQHYDPAALARVICGFVTGAARGSGT
ncbi:MAG TPA: alpha/beta hydrolase [Gemmatimonadaceae bacterium]|jgi:pimeloyl-ACP methyl ester carboxylesterase|nr:alpha/beta hydrolase [Gemmatimonadaceae bacterium]